MCHPVLEVLHGVEAIMGGVWVFGQLVLFTMIGSKSDSQLRSLILFVSRFWGGTAYSSVSIGFHRIIWDDMPII